MTKNNIIFYIFMVAVSIFTYNYYTKDKIDFNIDPTLHLTTITKPQVYTEQTDQQSQIDYNKLYYHQRLALAQALDQQQPASSPTQAQTNTQNPPYNAKSQTYIQSSTPKTIQVLDTAQYQRLIAQAETWIGTPYVWGGTQKIKGADCSGFTQGVYKELGINLMRVSKDQSKQGKLVSRHDLLPGDLLFFDTTNYRNSSDITTPTEEMSHAEDIAKGIKPNVISHVGLYAGNGMMIHASSGDGKIMYQSLDVPYYQYRFINARRILVPQYKEVTIKS